MIQGGDKMKSNNFNLYENEFDLANKVNKLIDKYYYDENMKEQIKKKHELFHLLVLLELKEFHITSYIEIKPNEPGDAIIIDEYDGKHLIEIFRVFGDKENKLINDKMNNIFNFNYNLDIYCDFNLDKMTNIIVDKLKEKNTKEYLQDNQYKTKSILVVTCEHNRCAVCGDWLSTMISKELEAVMKDKNYDNLYIVDYMASGKDGGPIAFNIENNIKTLKDCGII